MSERTLKTAIVGCGKVAHFHAKALKDLPQSSFTAVCDTRIGNAEKFAETYGVKAYDDIAAMVSECGIDVVHICTPHPLHRAAAIPAIEAGAHVLIEKPLASTLADCDAILSAAKKSKVTVGTMVQRRFYSPCQRMKQAIDQGKIARPVLGTVTMLGWRDKEYYESDPWRGTWKGEGGGVLVNQAPHQIDLLHWYMGEVEELYGHWDNLNHPYIEVEDTALAVIRFKNGGIGNIVVSNSQNPALYGKVHIHGENGASIGVQTDGGAMFIAGMSTITEPPYNDIWTIEGEEKQLAQWQTDDRDFFNQVDAMYYYHRLQINDFLQAVVEQRKPAVDGEEGRKTVEIIEAIYRSTKSRLPVKFPL